ncbi:MAG: TIGR03067 domain-containing protein [Gemmataceae bacterium]|nr:TIGR03067 domain-containing protein [Gemmataceae bacterium]
MKTTIATTLLFTSGLVFLAAGEASDLDRLQGAWIVAALIEEGKAVPAGDLADLEVVVQKDIFTVNEKGKAIAQYQFTLAPAKTPKTIDFTHLIGKDKGTKEPGIYVIEKDQIKFCLDESKKARPTTFAGETYSVIVVKRKPAK